MILAYKHPINRNLHIKTFKPQLFCLLQVFKCVYSYVNVNENVTQFFIQFGNEHSRLFLIYIRLG